MNLDVVRWDGGWWFTHHGKTYWPYKTREEAEHDLRGLRRTERYETQPGFVRCDAAKKDT